MSELFDSSFINRLQRLALGMKLRLDDGRPGSRKSRSRGSSVEFSDYREYMPGDDFRRVDWNAYGRFEKLYLKLFMEEKEAAVTILLDTSASMDWGEPNKSAASRRLAAALAYVSLAGLDRVALRCMPDSRNSIGPAFSGKQSFPKLVRFLEDIEYGGQADIAGTVKDSSVKSGRGITIIISDLFTEGSLDDALKHLVFLRQTVYVCHMLAPGELQPVIPANARLVDVETGKWIEAASSRELSRAYDKALKSFRAGLRETCLKRGAEYMPMTSSMDIEEMLRMAVTGQ